MNTKIFLATALSIHILLLSFCFSVNAQNTQANEAALKTLNSFQKIINQDNYKSFGFQTPKEISNLRLGTSPVNVYLVRLDSLKKFQGGDGKNLLVNTNQIIYPVYSNNNLVSSIKLDYDNKNWTVESFGDRETVRYYQDALQKLDTIPANKTHLVKIPSLNIFLLMVDNAAINVELLGQQPIGELQPNVLTTLQDALLKIKPIANKYNGLPW